jgi:bifunctional non-homologous end joining protein LigD
MPESVQLEIDGRDVTITNPGKVFFPELGLTKLDLVRYYLSVAKGALRGVDGRPMVLKRYPNGATGEFFYQKRAPRPHPGWIETCVVHFPSGRSADLVVVRDAAQLAWVINLGCLDLNPWPVRAERPDFPDELRVDLDPMPEVSWGDVREVALLCGEVLREHDLAGFPKTSGSRGIHVNVRIEPRWDFTDVRRAALALAREVERRAPEIATSAWWKEERHGVFIDYNQNARDRTVASAYSVRARPDARVSCPLTWDEVADVDPGAFTVRTVPERFASIGDPAEGLEAAVGSIEGLLELAERQRREGLGDAPWPPHFAKQAGEPPRVQPSKRRKDLAKGRTGSKGTVPPPAPGKKVGPTGRRRTMKPLIEIARAATEGEAREGLERWKSRHEDVWSYLKPSDVLVDSMRGRSTTWTRIRLNLEHVPEDQRPPQEALEVDYDPWEGVAWPEKPPEEESQGG